MLALYKLDYCYYYYYSFTAKTTTECASKRISVNQSVFHYQVTKFNVGSLPFWTTRYFMKHTFCVNKQKLYAVKHSLCFNKHKQTNKSLCGRTALCCKIWYNILWNKALCENRHFAKYSWTKNYQKRAESDKHICTTLTENLHIAYSSMWKKCFQIIANYIHCGPQKMPF